MLAMHTEASKLIYKRLTPYVLGVAKQRNMPWIATAYHVVLVVYTNLVINYNFCAFFTLSFAVNWATLVQTYFCIHLLSIAIYIWLTFAPPKLASASHKAEE